MNRPDFKTKVFKPILQFLDRADGTKEEAVALALSLYPLIPPTRRAVRSHQSLYAIGQEGQRLMLAHIGFLEATGDTLLDSRVSYVLRDFDYDICLITSNKRKWAGRAGDLHYLLTCYAVHLAERELIPSKFKADHRPAFADKVRQYGAAYQL